MKTVLISVKDGYADVWAKDFVAVYTNRQTQVKMGGTVDLVLPRFNVMMSNTPNTDAVIKTVKDAVKIAKAGGILVFNVGHGGVNANAGTGSADGWVDLSPNGSFKLGGLNVTNSFVNVFYDFAIPRPNVKPKSDFDNDKQFNPKSEKLKRWAKYQELCKTIKDGQLKKVVFLTCRIGDAVDFLKKISMDFGTVCEAYKSKVQLTPQSSGRVRVHLQSDSPNFGTNIAANEENLMVGIKANDVVLVGPPLK